jgi:branched-chain amino acid transport system substrate-binding protein
MDTNHWYNPLNPKAADLRKRVEAKGLDFSYEVYLNYNAVMWLADSIERARSAKREAIVEALATSTWSGHLLPYGPTKIVDGQNTGAMAATLQVQGNDIQVILPKQFASAKIVFPVPA